MKYCTCPDWQPNIDHITKIIHTLPYGATVYDLTVFKYCPWCGSLLKETDNNFNISFEANNGITSS